MTGDTVNETPRDITGNGRTLDQETVGARIARARRSRKLSQQELAARIGVQQKTVSEWELDHRCPNGWALAKLARALDVSADYLLGLAPGRRIPSASAELAELGKKLGFKPGFEDSLYFPESPDAPGAEEFYREVVGLVQAASDLNAALLEFLETWRLPEGGGNGFYPAPLYDTRAEYRPEPFPHVFIRIPEVPSRMAATMRNRRQVKNHWRGLVEQAIRDLEVPPEGRFDKTLVWVRYCVLFGHGAGADADNYPTRAIINGLWPKLIPDDSWARMAFAVTVDRVKENPGTEMVLMDFEAARKRLFGIQELEK